MGTIRRLGVIFVSLFFVLSDPGWGNCVPSSGSDSDDAIVCTGTVNGWIRARGGSDHIVADGIDGSAVFWLDHLPAGDPLRDGNDSFEANESRFSWVFGFGGDDRITVRDSVFDNIYADTNPYYVTQRGNDTITVRDSVSDGWILGGNDNDRIVIIESNVSFVAAGYSDIYPDPRPGHEGLFDYTPFDGNDTIVLEGVAFNVPNYVYPERPGGAEGGKGDDTIVLRGQGIGKWITGGHGNDRIVVEGNWTFTPCTFRNDLNKTVHCGIYGDESYDSEPNASVVPVLHGDDVIVLHGGDFRGVHIEGGDGSDRLVIDPEIRIESTLLDGGTTAMFRMGSSIR